MDASGRFLAAGQKLRIAKIGQLGVEEFAAQGGVGTPRETSNWATTAGMPAARPKAAILSASCEWIRHRLDMINRDQEDRDQRLGTRASEMKKRRSGLKTLTTATTDH